MKNKKGIRFLAFLLVIAMVLSCGAFAQPEGEPAAQENTNAMPYAQPDEPKEGAGDAMTADGTLTETETEGENQPPEEESNSDPYGMDKFAEYNDMLSYDASSLDDSAAAIKQEPRMPKAGTYIEGQLLVKLSRPASLQAETDIFSGLANAVQSVFSVPVDKETASLAADGDKMADWYCVDLADGVDMMDAWGTLLDEDSVMAVEPNYIANGDSSVEQVSDTSDPYIHSQTWLDMIKAPEAWDTIKNSGNTPGVKSNAANVVVAVVDSGVDLNHPDLKDNLIAGYDFVQNDNEPQDVKGHGTHVAGIIAAETNAMGVRGVAYGAQIMPVRVLNNAGEGSNGNIAAGIVYASGKSVSNSANAQVQSTIKADVINLSLGGFGSSGNDIIADAMRYARSQGCLVVASAGNSNLPTTYAGDGYCGAYVSPANVPGVLTVMAMDTKAHENGDWLADYSNYDADPGNGYEYEIMAPGTDILSTGIGGDYVYMSGTSMACPVTAGAAAVLMGMGCNADEAWELLVGTGDTLQGVTQPDGTVRSYPALNLAAAVNQAVSQSKTFAPKITNAYICAQLDSFTVGGVNISAGAVNTSDLVFYQDGKLLSNFTLYVENMGGSAESVNVSGTVSVNGSVCGQVSGSCGSIQAGGTAGVELTVTPTTIATGKTKLDLTISAGGAQPVKESREFAAYDISTPDGISHNSGSCSLTRTSVEISAPTNATYGRMLVLPHTLTIANGQSLTVNNSIIYEANGAGINVAAQGKFISRNNSCMSEGYFYLSDNATGDYGAFIYCGYIYSPLVTNAKVLLQTRMPRHIYTGCSVSADFIRLCYFSGLQSASITGTKFLNNMVVGCVDTQISSPCIELNSFVENGDYLTDTATDVKPLKIYTVDYDASNQSGFVYNCVVGPIGVYKSEDQAAATIGENYYQPVNSSSGEDDEILCANPALAGNNIADCGFAECCPAFVVSGQAGQFRVVNRFSYIYSATYSFSTPVAMPTDIYVDSLTDPCYISSSVPNDGNTCQIYGQSCIFDYDITNYYQLKGYYTATYQNKNSGQESEVPYWSTAMENQAGYNMPIEFNIPRAQNMAVSASLTGGHMNISWPEISSAVYAEIYRSVDGGGWTEIGSWVSATEQFVDAEPVQSGHVYSYDVALYSSDEAYVATGGVSTVITLNNSDMGMNFSAQEFSSPTQQTLNVELNGAWLAEDCLQFTVGAKGDGNVSIASISFAQQLSDNTIPCGAVKNDDGSITVYIGIEDSNVNYTLYGGDLFTVCLTTDDGTDSKITVTDVKNNGEMCSWQAIDTAKLIYSSARGSLAYDYSGEFANVDVVDPSAVGIYYATYQENGRMTGTGQVLQRGIMKLRDKMGDNACAKLFFLDGNKQPIIESIKLTKTDG